MSHSAPIPFGKFGPRIPLRGLHCTLPYAGRSLLGTIESVRYSEIAPRGFYLTVRHFDGSPWPVEPSAGAVRLLDRTWNPA